MACWREMGFPAWVYFNRSASRTFEFCDSAPTIQASRQCKSQFVPDYASFYGFNLTIAKRMCDLDLKNDPEYAGICYSELIKYKISYVFFLDESKDVISLCNSVDEKYKISCFSKIGSALKEKGTPLNGRKEFCKDVDEKYLMNCLNI